ncbi:poly-beta-1,6-N-acetyl-D-glucosamine biosynthesis protein PgaD, partial [Acinetobacter johnsonii]|uniref:poly-beta-1,6-N-acetyl-D-glucosamine biosynthesis protein PgaD n=1 Tax=Acinetobacter johnsonii TaxID=40214 RepID=UPI003AF63F3D
NKTAGYSLLALGWVMWMWLFLPLLTLLFCWFEGNLVYEQLIVAEMPKKPLNLFHLMGLITIFILCHFLWASYNWYRVRNNEKRLFPTHVE